MQTGTPPEKCLLCRSTDQTKIGTSHSFNVDILECGMCGFVQCAFVPDAVLKRYYRSEAYRGKLTASTLHKIKKNAVDQAASQLIYVNSILFNHIFERALDFGGADGALAEMLLVKAEKVYVSEVDPRYVELLQHNPQLAFLDEGELDTPRFQGFFDFISLSHVLEHLPDPFAALERFRRLLTPGGHLFLDLPNEIEILKKTAFQGKGHLLFFSKETLRRLVDIHGKFDIVDLRTCNRSVQAFIASGATMEEAYFRQDTENGTTIRVLLNKKIDS